MNIYEWPSRRPDARAAHATALVPTRLAFAVPHRSSTLRCISHPLAPADPRAYLYVFPHTVRTQARARTHVALPLKYLYVVSSRFFILYFVFGFFFFSNFFSPSRPIIPTLPFSFRSINCGTLAYPSPYHDSSPSVRTSSALRLPAFSLHVNLRRGIETALTANISYRSDES